MKRTSFQRSDISHHHQGDLAVEGREAEVLCIHLIKWGGEERFVVLDAGKGNNDRGQQYKEKRGRQWGRDGSECSAVCANMRLGCDADENFYRTAIQYTSVGSET